jgi:hypothetical protein
LTREDGVCRTIAEYCTFLDRRRFEDWSNLFSEDGEFNEWQGRATILANIRAGELASTPELALRHLTSNTLIDFHGCLATASSDLVVFQRISEGPWVVRHLGHYDDLLVHHADRWLFTKRQLTFFD